MNAVAAVCAARPHDLVQLTDLRTPVASDESHWSSLAMAPDTDSATIPPAPRTRLASFVMIYMHNDRIMHGWVRAVPSSKQMRRMFLQNVTNVKIPTVGLLFDGTSTTTGF